jgi:hypothetical protein
MHYWVIKEKEPQREVKNRLQFFHFQTSAVTQVAEGYDNKVEVSPVSYLTAVAGANSRITTDTITPEQSRLRALCLEPAVPTMRLRERTADEAAAILMIFNHEIEIPRVRIFLTQSMTAGELACFEDMFMALEYPLYAHLAPGQRFFDNMTKSALLAQLHVGAEAAIQKTELLAFKSGLSRITLDMATRVVKVTFKGELSAARWIDWQMPLAGRALRLHDYESVRERARTTYELVDLDYYSLVVEVHIGSLTSRDVFWIMTTALGLTVQAMTLASSGDNGIKEQQWNVRLQAPGCPQKLTKVGYLKVGNAEVMIHHNTIHVNWPCKRCHSPEHPTKYCKTAEEAREVELQKYTLSLTGSLPSSIGKSSRDYKAREQPRTIQQLESLLRQEGAQLTRKPKEVSSAQPKKPARSKSPRKREARDEKEDQSCLLNGGRRLWNRRKQGMAPQT